MTDGEPRPRGVHLVGSVPLASAEEVFRTASAILGPRLRRVSDGETGDRTRWIHWQSSVFTRHPAFEPAEPAASGYSAGASVRLRRDAAAAGLAFGPLGYAEVARASWACLSRLERAGEVSAGLRFQVSLPTALAPVTWFVDPRDHAAVEPAYEAAMIAEADAIAAVVPRERLAIQWDVAVEVALLEGLRPAHFTDVAGGIVERLVRLGNAIPAGVELGYHLCYGDADHRHFREPEDLSKLVRLANGIAAGLMRPLDWIHVPVPRDRADAAYFAPLAALRLPPPARLHLGLVHRSDGAAGAWRRIRAARAFVRDFGVGTECGLGRRPPETIPDLLKLHAEIADPV
jgi:hypothetical protein